MAPRAAAPGTRALPSRENRVRKRAEFLSIQQGGVRVSGDRLVFVLKRREPGQPLRLGITASRKIGGAVQRNRARRLIREAFRALFTELPGALDLVVIVRRPLGASKLADVLGELQRALPRIRRAAE